MKYELDETNIFIVNFLIKSLGLLLYIYLYFKILIFLIVHTKEKNYLCTLMPQRLSIFTLKLVHMWHEEVHLPGIGTPLKSSFYFSFFGWEIPILIIVMKIERQSWIIMSITLYLVIKDFLTILRLFKDMVFKFGLMITMLYCHMYNLRYTYQT